MNTSSMTNHNKFKRTFHFKIGESVEDGIRRMICEQIDHTVWQLQVLPDGPEKAVHRARKSFKRIRTLLRLVRDELGGKRYRRENACYRDISRMLAAGRDSVAQIETLDNLLAQSQDKLSADRFVKVREKLVERRHAVYKTTLEDTDNMEKVVHALEKARKRAQKLPVKTNGFPAIKKGLSRIYRQGKTRFSDAYESSDVEVFHDWRKRVKYLWNMCRILKPISPERIDALAVNLKQISDLLGDDHDLSDLRTILSDNPHWFEHASDMKLLFSVIDSNSQALRKKARPLGKKFYAEKPRAFTKQIGRDWNHWHKKTT